MRAPLTDPTFQSNPTLLKLEFPKNDMKSVGAAAIADALKVQSQTHCIFKSTSSFVVCVVVLCCGMNFFQENSRLTDLTLRRNDIGLRVGALAFMLDHFDTYCMCVCVCACVCLCLRAGC